MNYAKASGSWSESLFVSFIEGLLTCFSESTSPSKSKRKQTSNVLDTFMNMSAEDLNFQNNYDVLN